MYISWYWTLRSHVVVTIWQLLYWFMDYGYGQILFSSLHRYYLTVLRDRTSSWPGPIAFMSGGEHSPGQNNTTNNFVSMILTIKWTQAYTNHGSACVLVNHFDSCKPLACLISTSGIALFFTKLSINLVFHSLTCIVMCARNCLLTIFCP